MKIFIVEDDPEIRELEQYALESSGFQAESFSSAAPFYTALSAGTPDLILLDILLPGLNGLEVLRRYRKDGGSAPVILLTARDTVVDKVAGLDSGADDYVTKPFAIEELLARIRAALRSAGGRQESQSHQFTAGPVTLDPDSRKVTVNGTPV